MTSPPPSKSRFIEHLDTISTRTYNSSLNVSLEDILAETEARRRSSSGESNPRSGNTSPTSPISPTSPTADTAAKGRLRRISLMGKHRS